MSTKWSHSRPVTGSTFPCYPDAIHTPGHTECRFSNRKEAARNVRSYRRRGLDPMPTSMVDDLIAQPVQVAQVLEVGGGVGAIQLELLKAGVASSVNVELAAGYDDAAAALAAEEGLDGRIARHIREFDDFIISTDQLAGGRTACRYLYRPVTHSPVGVG